MSELIDITDYFILGDSLSDSGVLNDSFIMRLLSGLTKAPGDSFTNGSPWPDHFGAALANEFTIKKLMKELKIDSADLSDAIITRDKKISPAIKDFFDLKYDKYFTYRGKVFVRNYSEGGLTSHDYSWIPTTSISRFFSRLILATLADKRHELLKDAKNNKITDEQKNKTLIIEWSGANDFITVNAKPSKQAADLALEDRIKNVKELAKKGGFRHFVLFNLPDLSLTPRYQAKSKTEQDNARNWSLYFNEQLEIECKKLQKLFPECSIHVFDANKEFTDMYKYPEKYNLDPAKRNKPFIKSKEYVIKKNGTAPANGWTFYDDVHPTEDVQTGLAHRLLDFLSQIYNFKSPVEEVLHDRRLQTTKNYMAFKNQSFFNLNNKFDPDNNNQGKQVKQGMSRRMN